MTEPNPDRDTVRTLTGLTATEVPDASIDGLLQLNAGAARLAAADVLEAFAGTLVDFQSDDATLMGSKRATTLMARAKSLREQHYTASGEDFFFDTANLGGQRCGFPYRDGWEGL